MFCPRCGLGQPVDHAYCVSCGARLPGEFLPRRAAKVSRWFLGIPVIADDPPRAALRASRYLEEFEMVTAEGSVRVPNHHVRFSVWVDDRATCAVSLPDDEAAELARFLLAEVPNGEERLVTS